MNRASVIQKIAVVILMGLAVTVAVPSAAQDWIKTGTGLGVERIRIAVPDFKAASQDPRNDELLRTFNDTLWNDLNNAGIFETKPFLEVDEAYLDRFLNTNLKGTYFTTQAVIPQMLKQHDGVVINIGTPLVNRGFGGVPITAQMASKGAINALTIQLAAEFGKDNIRVNTIAPGTIRTPMHGENADEAAGLHLLNRVGEVEDIAEMVYTVAKSNFITGAIINVDGGIAAGHNLN